jgi:hypothetical protein
MKARGGSIGRKPDPSSRLVEALKRHRDLFGCSYMIKSIEPLGKHDRAAFSCGVAALDDWFHLRAGQDEKRNMARVFVAIDDQRGIVGFYSLSSFTLAITDLPPEHAKRLPRYDLSRRRNRRPSAR